MLEGNGGIQRLERSPHRQVADAFLESNLFRKSHCQHIVCQRRIGQCRERSTLQSSFQFFTTESACFFTSSTFQCPGRAIASLIKHLERIALAPSQGITLAYSQTGSVILERCLNASFLHKSIRNLFICTAYQA